MSFKPYTEKIKKKKIGICSASQWYGSETLFIKLVDFLCATRINTGTVSWFHDVSPDPDPQHWYKHIIGLIDGLIDWFELFLVNIY